MNARNLKDPSLTGGPSQKRNQQFNQSPPYHFNRDLKTHFKIRDHQTSIALGVYGRGIFFSRVVS